VPQNAKNSRNGWLVRQLCFTSCEPSTRKDRGVFCSKDFFLIDFFHVGQSGVMKNVNDTPSQARPAHKCTLHAPSGLLIVSCALSAGFTVTCDCEDVLGGKAAEHPTTGHRKNHNGCFSFQAKLMTSAATSLSSNCAGSHPSLSKADFKR